ncbi:MAG: hypothetical protein H7256_07940 [Bdellovibrio sp.]|nr:hypothetical protein [Bdellovibrio sp.]
MHSDKKWLIKSENKVLGPYNFEQIEDLLLKKQISLIDEVRDTDTRWLYLRENPEFKKTIDAIRARLDSKAESTKAIHTNVSHVVSMTATANTEGTTTLNQQTKSMVPQYTDVNVQEASVVSEQINEVISKAQEDSDSNERARAATKVKNYAFHSDIRTKEKVSIFSKRFFIGLVTIFILAAGGMSGYAYYTKYSQQKTEQDLISQIKRYKLLGLDQKALDAYAKLPVLLQQKYLVDVVELFPLLEAAGLVQVKDLDTVERSPDLTLENKVSILLARFWFFMQTQNFELAQNQIVKAKAIQPANKIVIENEAILDLKNGQYKKAVDAFVKLYSLESAGRYIVGAIQGLQGLSPAERSKMSPDIERLVDRHVATKYDFKKELLLAQLAFAKNHDNDILFKLSWKQFLNTPTQLQALFKKPLLVAPFSYLWKDLESYKATVRQGLPPTDEVLFQIHNYLESSQLSAAVDYADKNTNSISDIAIKQQITLMIDFALNKRQDIVMLERADKLDKKSELNHLLLALNQVELNPSKAIDSHIEFFRNNNLKFYGQWVRLARLIKLNSVPEIQAYLKDNFLTEEDFVPVQEARGLVEP